MEQTGAGWPPHSAAAGAWQGLGGDGGKQSGRPPPLPLPQSPGGVGCPVHNASWTCHLTRCTLSNVTETDSEHEKAFLGFFCSMFWIKLEKVSQRKQWLKVGIKMTND